VKSYLPLVFFFLASQDASAPVLVEDEPLHHTVLKNDSVRVLHLTLAPGERTLYHTHTHDRVAVNLSSTSITQQNYNQPEGPPTSTSPCEFSAITLVGNSFTHRVHNVGPVPFDVIDVEILQHPEAPSIPTAAAVAGENPSARVYKWVLVPGSSLPMHRHVRPFLLVSTTTFQLKMSSPDGQSFTHEVQPGDFHWVDTKIIHSLSTKENITACIIEIELK
jgi:quercetin dioxygenase-like cupin family protein